MLKLYRSVVIVLSSFFILVIPRYSIAELQSIDDPVYGADSITYDTESGLEWLDLTFSLEMTKSEVTEELGPAGYFAGFRRASRVEVGGLFTSAAPSWPLAPGVQGLPYGETDLVAAVEEAVLFAELIGPTYGNSTGCSAISGMTSDCYGVGGNLCVVIFLGCAPSIGGLRYSLAEFLYNTNEWWASYNTGHFFNTGHFLVREASPLRRVQQLASHVQYLDINFGVANSLYSKLSAVSHVLDDANENNDVSAIKKLQAFINAVEAQWGKHIPEADAEDLIAAAQGIIDMLSLQ